MRRVAREAAFKLIYQSMFTKGDELSLGLILDELETKDEEFALKIYETYKQNMARIQEILQQNVIGYETERIYRVDVALLYLAITEIKFIGEVPAPVVISEVVDISKRYSTEKSYGFINAVMSAIIKV